MSCNARQCHWEANYCCLSTNLSGILLRNNLQEGRNRTKITYRIDARGLRWNNLCLNWLYYFQETNWLFNCSFLAHLRIPILVSFSNSPDHNQRVKWTNSNLQRKTRRCGRPLRRRIRKVHSKVQESMDTKTDKIYHKTKVPHPV